MSCKDCVHFAVCASTFTHFWYNKEFTKNDFCKLYLSKSGIELAVNTVQEQKEEITRLETELKAMRATANGFKNHNKKLQNHIDEQTTAFYNKGIHTLSNRLKMQSVLVGDELYITMEESELDGLVKELTGCD